MRDQVWNGFRWFAGVVIEAGLFGLVVGFVILNAEFANNVRHDTRALVARLNAAVEVGLDTHTQWGDAREVDFRTDVDERLTDLEGQLPEDVLACLQVAVGRAKTVLAGSGSIIDLRALAVASRKDLSRARDEVDRWHTHRVWFFGFFREVDSRDCSKT